jgi:CubicO group peptidase (beta-lactamase class C family)
MLRQVSLLAIIDSSGIHYFNFGKTAEDGKQVDEHTIYEIGSITKVFTGILLAQQVLDGNLKLEDEINSYLPGILKFLRWVIPGLPLAALLIILPEFPECLTTLLPPTPIILLQTIR